MIPQETTRLLPLTKNETAEDRRRQQEHSILRPRQLVVVVTAAIVGTVVAIACLVGYRHSSSSSSSSSSTPSSLLTSDDRSPALKRSRDEQFRKWDDWKAASFSRPEDATTNQWWKGIGTTQQQQQEAFQSKVVEQQLKSDNEPLASQQSKATLEDSYSDSTWSHHPNEAAHEMWMAMQQQQQHSHEWWKEMSSDEQARQNATFQHLRRFGQLLREWYKSTVHAAQHDKDVLGRDMGEWWNETENVDGQNVKKWWNHTEQEAQHDEHAAGQNIEGWWNKTEQAAEHDEHAVGQNIRGWWNHTEQAAERDEHAVGQNVRKWWNHTEQAAESDEHAVGQWWNRTENAVEQDEERMQRNFQEWWKHSRQKEKSWWNHTVLAFRHFAHAADKREHEWWNMTKHATKDAWNATKEEEERFWHAAQHWFQAHESYATEMNTPLLYLNTSRAYSLLMGDYGWYDYSSDFFLYQSGWDAQTNQAYCAVASAAAVLNSLRNVVELPIDPLYDPHPYATQHSVLDSQCVNEHVIHYSENFDGIFHVPGGLSLDQAQGLLECHLPASFNVTVHHADPNITTVAKMKRDLSMALKDPTARVMVNFDRSILDQEGYGHFSPLGSYNKMEDAFLIMDVAKYKYPPAWVTAGRLFASMGTIDACGEWDYPTGQESLRPELLEPNSTHLYHKALKKLHCREDFRGYIIVRQN